ncbi:substrate-binding domain-containing protein [Candidatus Merdisoma sp. JLR.KK006]|uniref:substrate-binding domain-containing protein n=1 Tax=Candidatus Merdisoma sp. JLR.KK006 TaxID=3112626 RepID=UPI002FEFF1AB
MKKKVLAAIMAGVMLLGLTACGSKEQAPAETDTPETGAAGETEEPANEENASGGETIKIGVLMKTMSDTYSNKLGEAIQAYATDTYSEVELYLMDGQADIAKQISQAEDLIAKQVDVIILNPQDADGSAQVLDLAADADVPVIEVNTETTRTDYVSFVGSDDRQAGEIMGNFVMEQLGADGGQYAILEGEMGQSAQLLRYEGLENTILANEAFDCAATLSANWSRDEAMATTEDWLGKYADLKAIICENDDMSMGALQAAESQNRELVIIGTDAIPDALQAVKDGRLSGTVLQDADTQASTSVDVAVKVAKGETVEARYDVPFQLITIDNVDDFIE